MRVALIGDFDANITAHVAIPRALSLAGIDLGVDVSWTWLPTDAIANEHDLEEFGGFWCVPGSPYRDMEGALRAIRFARERSRPFLGTCGGFQHAIIEYARHVLGWQDADHAEVTPDARRAVVSPLTCALIEARETLRLVPGTTIAEAYGTLEIEETYRCSFGINPAWADQLLSGPLHPVARDSKGDVRAVELTGHPFYVATLFQHERAALNGTVPPLARALIRALVSR